MSTTPLTATTASFPPSVDGRPASSRRVLAALSLCTLLPSLGTSVANAGLPALAAAFGASFPAVQWVVLSYLLTLTTFIVMVGRLGDLLGKKRLLLAGLALFVAASAGCAAAPGLWTLIAARALQGLGAAALMALSLALAGGSVPREQLGRLMGALGTMSAVGTALGPSLGGLLITVFGWPAMFWVNVPLGFAAWKLAVRALPEDPATPTAGRARLPLASVGLLALALSGYTLALTLGRGHFGSLNLLLLAGAAAAALLFVRTELRAESPLVHLSVFRENAIRDGLILSLLVATVLMTTLVVGPFFLSRGLGLSPARVGLVLSVGPLLAAVAGIPAGRAVDRFGPRRATLAGLGAILVGSVVLASCAVRLAGYIGALGTITLGYALFQAANNTAVLGGLDPARRGVVSGALNLARNLGLISGASAMGAVFAFATAAHDVSAAAPAAVAGGLRFTFAVAAAVVTVGLLFAARRDPAQRGHSA